MIDEASLQRLVRAALPDAEVAVRDDTGTMDHYSVRVRSKVFSGKSLLDQHRMVYAALSDALQDGRIHAVQIQTIIAE